MMRLPFTSKQAGPKDALCLLEGAALNEMRILCHQYIADIVRMIREVHLTVQHFERDEVSIAREVLQKSERILTKSQEWKSLLTSIGDA